MQSRNKSILRIYLISRNKSNLSTNSAMSPGWSLHGDSQISVGHKRQHVINRRLRLLPTCPEWLRLSRRARDTAATMLNHSTHSGEWATKTIKFFVAHTVNYVICNNHTRIDWVLLNFTPVIQQNYHQLGRKFEKSFCAVDRLSCQLELSKSETSQFGSELFLIS